MQEWNIICIVCPRGCHLHVTQDEQSDLVVTGNLCNRGIAYGKKEVTHPTRVITSTVKIHHPTFRRLPVVTKGSIPKGLMMDVMAQINQVEVNAPVTAGDIIIENVLNTGINVVATRSMN